MAQAAMLRYNATLHNGTLGGVACMDGVQPLTEANFNFTAEQKANISKTHLWAFNGDLMSSGQEVSIAAANATYEMYTRDIYTGDQASFFDYSTTTAMDYSPAMWDKFFV